MSGPARRFDPSELRDPGDPELSRADEAEARLAARELEALGAGATIRPTDGFEDRVMAAIAAEPAPRLIVRPASAVRGGIMASFVLTLRDSWRIATTAGRPAAVRAQALAFVLLVAVATTALAGVGAVGVGSLLERRDPTPSVQPGPTPAAPSPSGLPAPSPSAEPSGSPAVSPTGSAEPTSSDDTSETAEPTEKAEPTETEHAETARPTRTPRPTETPEPEDTPKPTKTPDGTDDHGGSGGGGPGHG